MFGKFSEEAQKVLVLAKKEMSELNHPYVGSEHLLLSILKTDNNVSRILKKYDITYKKFKDELIKLVGVGSFEAKWFLYTPLLKRVLENAVLMSKEEGDEVNIESLFLSLLDEGDGIAIRILVGLNVDIKKLYLSCSSKKRKGKKNLYLNEIAVNLSENPLNFDPVIGREEEIDRIIEILCRRTKNNPILIGEAGVGKTAIVEELSKRIKKDDVPKKLRNKKIYSLDMSNMVAGTKYRGEFEEKIRKIIKEVENNEDIILFIDEVHTIVGAGGAEGAIDASNIFKPSLARGKIKLIGATTIEEYKKNIEKDLALDRRFQKVFINEPDKNRVRDILLNLKVIYEDYHNVKIEDSVIDKIIELSNKYIYDRFEPDKSIDILDEVCANVSIKELKEETKLKQLLIEKKEILLRKSEALKNKNYNLACELKELEDKKEVLIKELKQKLITKEVKKKVTVKDVIKIVSKKTKIPIYELNNDYKKQFYVMKENIEKNIVGQEDAVKSLLQIAKKIKLGLKEENKSYSLLFCGPTGSGKTFLAKTFAENLVGKDNVIKLDMSEYIESTSINKLIGSPAGYIGYSDQKNIFEQIRNKPYSVLILDEIEKCSKNVLNLFLGILDEGKCKDSLGREIRFDNVLIIMTSNAIKTKSLVGFNNIDDNNLTSYFSKEFINRIDEIIEFKIFSEKEIEKIINIELKRYKSKEKISVSEIKKESNYKEYGARRIKKLIKKRIENNIIHNLI